MSTLSPAEGFFSESPSFFSNQDPDETFLPNLLNDDDKGDHPELPAPPILLKTNRLQPIASPSPLTPTFPTLAPLQPNLCPFYILQTTGGGGCPRSDQLVHPRRKQFSFPRSNHMRQLPPISASPRVTGHGSRATPPVPLRSSPLNAKITPLLAPETFARSTVSNNMSGPRLQRSATSSAQPTIASSPQVLLRRWGRKADRVRLGQCPLVG